MLLLVRLLRHLLPLTLVLVLLLEPRTRSTGCSSGLSLNLALSVPPSMALSLEVLSARVRWLARTVLVGVQRVTGTTVIANSHAIKSSRTRGV